MTDRGRGSHAGAGDAPDAYAGDCSSAPGGGHVYGVCNSNQACVEGDPTGSPSDTVILALKSFLPATFWPEGPDLVVAGINWGQNAGTVVTHSGTTNAAVTAHHLGKPAIALIGKLRNANLLKPATLLNVNYPHLEEGQQVGRPVLNVLDNGDMMAIPWDGTATVEGGTYNLGFPVDVPSTNKLADTTALAKGKISIVPMDGDWGIASPKKKLAKLVKALE